MVQLIGGMSTYLQPKLLQMSVEPVVTTIDSCSRLKLHLRSIYVSYSLNVNASTNGPIHEIVANSPCVVMHQVSCSSLPQSLLHQCYSICTQTTIPKPFRRLMTDKRLKIDELNVLVAFACIHTYVVDASSFLLALTAVAPVRMAVHLHTDKPKLCRPWMTNKKSRNL